jgi:uncharacterized membrane protein YgdD (TMEM256/DUF423 family)
MKRSIIIGSVLAGTAVILGALNAHALKQYFDPATTDSFATGVRYQMYHALAILIIGAISNFIGKRSTARISLLLLVGTILFSGSIYLLCAFKSNGIIGLTGLGVLTPIGGLVLTAGWIHLIISASKIKGAQH